MVALNSMLLKISIILLDVLKQHVRFIGKEHTRYASGKFMQQHSHRRNCRDAKH